MTIPQLLAIRCHLEASFLFMLRSEYVGGCSFGGTILVPPKLSLPESLIPSFLGIAFSIINDRPLFAIPVLYLWTCAPSYQDKIENLRSGKNRVKSSGYFTGNIQTIKYLPYYLFLIQSFLINPCAAIVNLKYS
jgi:hypothetical protein